MDKTLEDNLPIIYIPNESDKRTLKKICFEKRDNYYVLWYCWPFDGYVQFEKDRESPEDYEPVILRISNGKLVKIGIRPHNEYKSSDTWVSEKGRPAIVFTTPWHGAEIDKGGIFVNLKKRRLRRIEEYDVEECQPPEWFYKAGTDRTVDEFGASM